jgi:alcohol dehydrogenase class IV
MRGKSEKLELRKFVAPEIVFGEGALKKAASYAYNFGAKKVLLVTDPGVAKAGWSGKIENDLKKLSIPYVLFKDITPNPKDHEVMAGAEVYRNEGCDVIIAGGGGSPMDCAKGLGIVSTNNKHILEFEGVNKVSVPGPPLICIPTTAGTSADISQFAIITDTVRKVKIAIISKTMVPDVALIDPVTTTTMPAELTAATGLDAWVHAWEAYVSNASSPLTDLFSLEAVRLIRHNLIKVCRKPKEMQYRNNMMTASMLAGLAFSNASLGLVHGMAHSLGGFLDLAHGECNAVLLEHVVDFNFEAASEKYLHLAEIAGMNFRGVKTKDKKALIIKTLADFRNRAGIKGTLGTMGVTRRDIPSLAKKAIKDPCVITNPKQPTVQEIETIYEKAL